MKAKDLRERSMDDLRELEKSLARLACHRAGDDEIAELEAYTLDSKDVPEDEDSSRLLRLGDQRITRTGIIVIKSQQHRSLEMNRAEAIARLYEIVESAAYVPKKRKPTRPTASSKRKRLEGKRRRSSLKAQRARVFD